MKTLFCALFLLILLPFSSGAVTSPSKISLGFEASLSKIWLVYDEPFDIWRDAFRFGYSAGGAIQYHLSRSFLAESGLLVELLGNKHTFHGDSALVATLADYTLMSLYYASVPIKLQLQFGSSPFHLIGGTVLSYLIKNEATWRSSSLPDQNKTSDYTKDLKPFNASLSIGLGYQLCFENYKLVFHLEPQFGITNLGKEERWYSPFYTRTFKLTILYFI